MNRKRLQNVADNLCYIFCGWRLIWSKPTLLELGAGILEIDALNAQTMFSGKPIRHLPITSELSHWLLKELKAHQIPTTEILHARLKVDFIFSKVPWNVKTREIFCIDGKSVVTKQMHRCRFDCESEVAITGKVYGAHLKEVHEWPIGWPKQNASLSWTKFLRS